MILTLFFTILIEGMVAAGYCVWHKKPLGSILLTSVLANLITQSLLWIGLGLLFRHYLIVLFIAELFIWIIEGFLLYGIPANRLRLQEAMRISLLMNLASFSLGWFLPA